METGIARTGTKVLSNLQHKKNNNDHEEAKPLRTIHLPSLIRHFHTDYRTQKETV